MKKILLSVISLISFTAAFSQCIPDGQTNGQIAYPVPGTSAGSGDTLSSDGVLDPNVIQFNIPADTNVGIEVTVDSVKLTGITGLPTGVSYACNISSCTWNGGTFGCLQFSGSPSTGPLGSIKISLQIATSITSIPYDIYYRMPGGTVGIEETLSSNSFSIVQNVPNPFADKTNIAFSTPNSTNVTFEMFNLLGEKVNSRQLKANSGVNNIEVDGSTLNNGVYFYSLNNGEKTLTGKMTVSK